MLASAADRCVSKLGDASIAITSDVYVQLIGTVASDAVTGAAHLMSHTVHAHEVVGARSEPMRFSLGWIVHLLAWRNW